MIQTDPSGVTGLDDRFESFQYDPKGRFVTQRTNALGHTATAEYEPAFGNMTKQTDATGLVTRNVYDAFGRITKTITPEGNAITTTRDWASGSPANAVFFAETQAPGAPDARTYFDLLGRELLTETDGFSGTVSVERTYNARGELISLTHPSYASDPVKTITYSYNNDYGFLAAENNNGLTTTYSNSGNTTTISDPAGQTFTRTMDASGALVSATDAGGTVSYSYFSHGGAKEITAAGAPPTQMDYDEYGRQKELTDPNAGKTEYKYNAFGELTEQKDANGNIYDEIQYDQLGRITSKRETDGATGNVVGNYNYFYETTINGLGNLKTITAPNNNATAYQYDQFSRPIKLTETIAGEDFETQYEYDNFGNMTKMTYPFGYAIERTYNNTGYLAEVKTPQGTIFTTDEMNALSQYTKYTLGNGNQTQNTFDDFGRPLTSLAVEVQTQQANTQILLYGWNNSSGNLNFRTDNTKSLTETFTPYDNLNRLTSYNVTGLSPLSVGYAGNGNIDNKTDAGVYTYSPTKPHAVETVTDPEGLMPLTQDITYTAFQRPATITQGVYDLTFTYGTSQQRKKSILTNLSTGTVEKTITYAGNYEKIEVGSDVYEVHYINIGPALAINVRQNGGADQLFYAYRDHLGSILTLTDATGNIVYEQNFDPWGRERNPTTWDYTANPNTKPEWLIRGFTGHEQLNEMRLINMNARLYDPIVGRVLSPDNYVQENATTQGFNRYSYALNNPLVYTDPDGENPLILIPILIGAYLGGVATNQGELNPGQWDWNSGYTYAGIAGGAFAGYLGGYWLFHPGSVNLAVGATVPGASIYAVGQGSDWSLQWTNEAGGQGQIDLNKPVTAGDLLAGSNESVNYYAGGYEETSTVYDPQMAAALARQAGAEVRVGPLKTVGVIGGEIYTEPYNPIIEAIYQGQRDFLHHPVTQMTISLLPVGGIAGGVARSATLGRSYTLYKAGRNFRIDYDWRWALHYHRRGSSAGQGIGRHRPWQTKSTDQWFWNRF